MIIRSGLHWHKANESRLSTRKDPESKPTDWCDNDFESYNSEELVSESSTTSSSEEELDSEEARNIAEIYGHSPIMRNTK